MALSHLKVTVGPFVFEARLEREKAPETCRILKPSCRSATRRSIRAGRARRSGCPWAISSSARVSKTTRPSLARRHPALSRRLQRNGTAVCLWLLAVCEQDGRAGGQSLFDGGEGAGAAGGHGQDGSLAGRAGYCLRGDVVPRKSPLPNPPHKGEGLTRPCAPTSPLRGEVAAKAAGGGEPTASSAFYNFCKLQALTPPRSCAPTLPLKGGCGRVVAARLLPPCGGDGRQARGGLCAQRKHSPLGGRVCEWSSCRLNEGRTLNALLRGSTPVPARAVCRARRGRGRFRPSASSGQ